MVMIVGYFVQQLKHDLPQTYAGNSKAYKIDILYQCDDLDSRYNLFICIFVLNLKPQC